MRTVLVEPLSGYVFAGTQGSGIFRSADGGKTWVSAAINPPAPNVFVNTIVSDDRQLIIVAGTGLTTGALYATTTGAGVLESVDGGLNWNTLNVPAGFPIEHGIAVAPSAAGVVYLSPDFTMVQKTTDGGNTWTVLPGGPAGAFATADLAVYPGNANIVLASAATSGPLISTDGGQTWGPTGMTTAAGSSGMAIDANGTLYVGTATGAAQVWKSINTGATFTTANVGVQGSVNALAIDPSTPATIYAALGGTGMFKSNDSGVTWFAINGGFASPTSCYSLTIDPKAPKTLYVATDTGVMKTTTGGQ